MIARAKTVETRSWRGRSVFILLALILAPAACRDAGREIVVFIGDEQIFRNDLEAYLRSNLAPGTDGTGSPARDRVKSRLLDALVDERLLIAEARRRGIDVEDAELEAHLMATSATDPSMNAESDPDTRRQAARTRLLVRMLLEQVRSGVPNPTEDEVKEYVELHRPRLVDRLQRIRVRTLQFGNVEEAQAAREAIVASGPPSEAARSALEAGRTATLDLARSGLPEPMRAAIDALEPGEISDPFEHRGSVYLFLVVARPDGPPGEKALLHLARNELTELKQRFAEEVLVETLRDRTAIRVTRQLPFRYIPAESAPPAP